MSTDDSICESSLHPNKSSGDIVERLRDLLIGRPVGFVLGVGDCLNVTLLPDERDFILRSLGSAAEIERLRRENTYLEALADNNDRSATYWLEQAGNYRWEAEEAKSRTLSAESSVAAAWEEAAKVADERASREKRFQVACINNGDHARAGEHAQARVACDAIASAIRAAVGKGD